jgi:hypothetical protein
MAIRYWISVVFFVGAGWPIRAEEKSASQPPTIVVPSTAPANRPAHIGFALGQVVNSPRDLVESPCKENL